jgi:hypothetical protein
MFDKGRKYPSLEKRGRVDFHKQVNSIFGLSTRATGSYLWARLVKKC